MRSGFNSVCPRPVLIIENQFVFDTIAPLFSETHTHTHTTETFSLTSSVVFSYHSVCRAAATWEPETDSSFPGRCWRCLLFLGLSFGPFIIFSLLSPCSRTWLCLRYHTLTGHKLVREQNVSRNKQTEQHYHRFWFAVFNVTSSWRFICVTSSSYLENIDSWVIRFSFLSLWEVFCIFIFCCLSSC